MPTISTYVAPEIVLTHNGVTIYHTYKNDEIEQGPSDYWFTLDPDDTEIDGETRFDVRELQVPSAVLLKAHPPYLSGPHWVAASSSTRAKWKRQWDDWHEFILPYTIGQVLVDAIEQGLLKNPH